MSIKVLACRSVIPDTICTLMFTGEEDEIVPAFSLHAESVHGETLDDELAARLTATLTGCYGLNVWVSRCLRGRP